MKVPVPLPRHALEPAPEENAFWFREGGAVRSLVELVVALRRVPVGAAWFHREHYAPWVRAVVGDEPLARRLEQYASGGADPEVYRDAVADLVETRVGELRAARLAASAPTSGAA